MNFDECYGGGQGVSPRCSPVSSLNTNVDGMTTGDAKPCPQEPDTGVVQGPLSTKNQVVGTFDCCKTLNVQLLNHTSPC
jgi:hypothetical protein